MKKLPKLYAFEKKRRIDLSLSENPLGCSPRVFRALKRSVKDLTRYPDPNSTKLRSLLSRRFQLPKEAILVGNGSENLIDLLCQTLLKKENEVVLPVLTFPLFERAVLIAGGRPVFAQMKPNFEINLKAIKRKITKQTKLIILCNPNNPTGKIISKKELVRFIKEINSIPVLIDEANIEFGGDSVISAIRERANLLVLRTFSKAFGLAGLRIGILFGPKKVITRVNRIRQPFPLNALAQETAIAALEDKKFIEKTKKFMGKERQFLTNELRKREFMVFNSETNNILVEVTRVFPNGNEFIKLLNKNDVSVVNGNSFQALGNQFFRLSPGLPKTNRAFIKAIDKIMASME